MPGTVTACAPEEAAAAAAADEAPAEKRYKFGATYMTINNPFFIAPMMA